MASYINILTAADKIAETDPETADDIRHLVREALTPVPTARLWRGRIRMIPVDTIDTSLRNEYAEILADTAKMLAAGGSVYSWIPAQLREIADKLQDESRVTQHVKG